MRPSLALGTIRSVTDTPRTADDDWDDALDVLWQVLRGAVNYELSGDAARPFGELLAYEVVYNLDRLGWRLRRAEPDSHVPPSPPPGTIHTMSGETDDIDVDLDPADIAESRACHIRELLDAWDGLRDSPDPITQADHLIAVANELTALRPWLEAEMVAGFAAAGDDLAADAALTPLPHGSGLGAGTPVTPSELHAMDAARRAVHGERLPESEDDQ
jgi:hypothetical protein